MNLNIEPNAESPIRIGELIWTKALHGGNFEEQERNLKKLIHAASVGLMLDCSRVEIGNSDVINLLMRIRSQAKKENKELVLFNAPDTLMKVIQICRLRGQLPIAKDAGAAMELIHGKASGKTSSQIWIESHWMMITFIGISFCVAIGFIAYLLLG